MRFSDQIKSRFPERREGLEEFERLFDSYDQRFRRWFIPRPARRSIGHHAASLLLTALARARLLTATMIHCTNGGVTPGMYLATRAHWEMTGLVAHVLTALRRFYEAEMSEPELETMLKRLALGRRWDVPTNIGEDVAAINALTLVGSAAKLLGSVDVEHYVQDCYAFLSEHCHPNLFGRLAGVTLRDGGRIEFEAAFAIAELDLSACLTRGIPSQRIFFHGYDECFQRLYQNEDMPSIEN